jgi:hypothetical protein
VEARGANWLRVVRALPARGSVIAADVAGAGDGTLARGVLRIGGGAAESSTSRYGTEDGHGYGAMGGQLQRVLRIAGGGARRVRVAQQAEVCSGDGRGRRGSRRQARGGDEDGMDDGHARCTCCALR